MTHTNLETYSTECTPPTIVYFSSDHSRSSECTSEVMSRVCCTFAFPSTWSELAVYLESGEQNIAFHINMIKKSHSSILDFLDAIRVLCKFMPLIEKLRIAVIIDKTTTQQEIAELRQHKAFGLLLDARHYSIEEVCTAITSLIIKIPYWPEHIISQLPNPAARPLSVYFRQDLKTYITPAMAEQFSKHLSLDISYCDSWAELGEAINGKPHQIVVHIGTIRRLESTIPEIISMIETRLKLAGLSIPVAVAIEPDTPMNVIKELKKCGVFGIVPSAATWGLDETITAIHALAERTPYWPKHIIGQLPGNKPVIENKKSGISITPRQSQVLDLVCNRGLSNKQIAKSMNISESTVKIHIGCILKEYGVRNRTQLVLAASSLLKA